MSRVVRRSLVLLTIFLVCLTSLFGLILSSPSSSSIPLTVSAEVRASCSLTFGTTSDATYTVSIYNGNYKDEIGKTNLTVACNTKEGFGVYAVGYSGDALGSNEMIASVSGASNIPTGNATSGNTSNWAVKVEAGTVGDTPSIISPFNSYTGIPNSYTKVAEVTENNISGNTVSSSIVPSYLVYISPTQGIGSYTGKVKYTVVQPPTSIPSGPQTPTAGKITYYPNAGGVKNTMSPQTASANSTVTLQASNYIRPGYGFVGWSDAYDYVVNAGSILNPNAKLYAAGEIITTASDFNTTGLNLYAVWAPSINSMQDWSGCSNLSIGSSTALTDIRDNNTYTITRMADGNCWMSENIRLANANSTITLNSETSDLPDGTTYTLPKAQTGGSGVWSDTRNPHLYLTANQSFGVHYNATAATAGTDNITSGEAAGSICPKGWKLPHAKTAPGFTTLMAAYNYDLPDATPSDTTNKNNLAMFFAPPFSYVAAGAYASEGRITDVGDGVWLHTSTMSGNNHYYLRIITKSSRGGYGASITSYTKTSGFPVRCLAN